MTTPGTEDTIVALASGRGAAGVAVVRMSGPAAIEIAGKSFSSRKDRPLTPYQLTYGTLYDSDGTPIDDCMVVVMPAPGSFTGEDVAEIQCHGSPAVIRAVIQTCLGAGARPAEPGEFSRRAFLNGKMDLAQAEALADLVASTSETARRLALRQLRGGLSARLKAINDSLIDAAAEIEAHLDFPEEDIPALAQDRIADSMSKGIAAMNSLLAGHEKARMQSEGARIILAGQPNAGKSSLFNALVGNERAIVSPHPGTTRDTIEAVVELGGLAVTLVDTAGIRSLAGEIEQFGIDRAHEEIRGADLVLHLSEGTRSGQPTDPAVGSTPHWLALDGADPDRVIRVWTKRDLLSGGEMAASTDYIEVSAATGAGLQALESLLLKRLLGGSEDDTDAEMSRVRHAELLRKAVQRTQAALDTFRSGESGDLVMVDLRDALISIGEILGERLDEQILDRIFSTFCLGK